MTVQEALNLPSLKGLEVVAGKSGLNRKISTVSVMDAPDIYKWMKGGEFLITSAYPIKDDVDYLTSLIERLNEAGIAAFGVKVSRFIGRLPEKAIKTAERLGIPLISIPENYAFTDIINPVLYSIIDQQTAMLMQSEKIHSLFLDLAINGGGVREIIQVLSEILEGPAAFIDIYFKKIYCSDDSSMLNDLVKNIDINNLDLEKLEGCNIYRVANKKVPYGYIITCKNKRGNADETNSQKAIEYAGIVLTLCIQTKISNQQIEEKYRDEFLGDLIFNNMKSLDEIHNRAQLYGWEFNHGGMVVIIDVNNLKRAYLRHLDNKANEEVSESVQKIFEISQFCIKEVFPDAKYYRQSDHVVYLISKKDKNISCVYDEIEKVFQNIRQRIAQKIRYTITIGVGSYYESIWDISKSYNEALTTINLAYQLNMMDCVLFYERLGIYRLLSSISGNSQTEEFQKKYVSPILQYDIKYHTSLLPTIKTIIDCAWNLKAASNKLFIHYNSVKYRFSKICELIGVDLHDHEQQLCMEIALKLYHINMKNTL